MAGPSKRRATLARFRSSRDGVTTIEFALIAFPFLFLIFAILETGIVFAADIVMDRAAEQVSREIRTGQIPAGAAGTAKIRERACDMMVVILGCEGLEIDMRAYDSFAQASVDTGFAADPTSARFDAIAGGKIMALRLRHEWSFTVGLLQREMMFQPLTLAGSAVFRTERF